MACACFTHLQWLRVAALTPRGCSADVRCRGADVELTLITLGRECRCALLRSGRTQDEEELLRCCADARLKMAQFAVMT